MDNKRIATLVFALVFCLAPASFGAMASDEPAFGGQATVVPGDGETPVAAADEEAPVPAWDDGDMAALDGDNSYTINGVTVTRTSSSITNNCFTYAMEIYRMIWGVGFSSDPSSGDNMLRGITSTEARRLTAENVERYISAAAPGAVIRLTGSAYLNSSSDSVGHNQLLVQKDSRGFTVLESNVTGGSREKYYTWSGYVSWWSGTANRDYFKYIKWPGAAAYDGPSVPDSCGCSEEYAGVYTCTTVSGGLNIRSGHGTSYASIGSIPPGAKVYVSMADGAWAHVEYNGIVGCASMVYLQKLDAEPQPTPAPTPTDPMPKPLDPDGDGVITERDAAMCLYSGDTFMAAMFLRFAVGL